MLFGSIRLAGLVVPDCIIFPPESFKHSGQVYISSQGTRGASEAAVRFVKFSQAAESQTQVIEDAFVSWRKLCGSFQTIYRRSIVAILINENPKLFSISGSSGST